MTVVFIPDGCESIGDSAFRDCLSLTRIRIPAGCELGTDVFSGCGRVFVFGPAGSRLRPTARSMTTACSWRNE